MPIYEYKCSCGEVFERMVKLKEADHLQKCECGKKAKRVEISGSSFRLKGNWFKTTGNY